MPCLHEFTDRYDAWRLIAAVHRLHRRCKCCVAKSGRDRNSSGVHAARLALGIALRVHHIDAAIDSSMTVL